MQSSEMRVIAVTNCSDIRPVMEGGVEVSCLYDQFRQVLAGRAGYRLFTKPVKALNGEGHPCYQWLSDVDGDVVPFVDLDEEKQNTLLRQTQIEIGDIQSLLKADTSLRPPDKRSLLSALSGAFEIPSISSLYQVGGQPVLIQWGHLLPNWDAPRGILQSIIAERVGEEDIGYVWVKVQESDGRLAHGIPVSAYDEQGNTVGGDVSGCSDPSGIVKLVGLVLGQQVTVRLSPGFNEAIAPDQVISAGTSYEQASGTLTLFRHRGVKLQVLNAKDDTPCVGMHVTTTLANGESEAGQTDQEGLCILDRVPINVAYLPIQITTAEGAVQGCTVRLSPDISTYTLRLKPKRHIKRHLLYAASGLIGVIALVAALWAACILPYGSKWCQFPPESELARQVRLKSTAVEIPKGSRLVRVEAYVNDGQGGIQLFSIDGDHLAGTVMADVGLDALSDQARTALIEALYIPNPRLVERYDATGINEGNAYDPDALHWTSHLGLNVGFSGTRQGER